MALDIHPRLLKAIRRVATVSWIVAFASTGVAFASCPARSVSTPFVQWGDTNAYFSVPGGSFEGTPDQVGWSLSNATLTSGNEPFSVNDSSDAQSLIINGGGSATSPYFCVNKTVQQWRLFANQLAAGNGLHIEALVQTSDSPRTVPLADLLDGSMSSWAPTQPIIRETSALPNGNSVMVALRFTVPSAEGSWQLDDIYVDPYRSG